MQFNITKELKEATVQALDLLQKMPLEAFKQFQLPVNIINNVRTAWDDVKHCAVIQAQAVGEAALTDAASVAGQVAAAANAEVAPSVESDPAPEAAQPVEAAPAPAAS